MASRSEISSSRSATRWANMDSDALVAAVTRTLGEHVGRNPWAATTSWVIGKVLESALELVKGTEGQLAHLGERLDPGSSSGALGHDEDPDRLDRAVSALGLSLRSARQDGPGRLNGVEGIGLAAVPSGLAVLTIHFDDRDPCSSEVTGDAGAVRTPCPRCRPWRSRRSHSARPTGPNSRRAPLQTSRVPSRTPTSSSTAATWTSPWVSMPPVTVRVASTMVMPSLPFLKR